MLFFRRADTDTRRGETSHPRSVEKECVTPRVCEHCRRAEADDGNGDNDTSRFFCYKTSRCYILPLWARPTPFSHRGGTNGAETRAGNSVSTYANLRNSVCAVFFDAALRRRPPPPPLLPPAPLPPSPPSLVLRPHARRPHARSLTLNLVFFRLQGTRLPCLTGVSLSLSLFFSHFIFVSLSSFLPCSSFILP